MIFSMLAAAVLTGLPLIFLPSYISESSAFERPLSPEEEKKYLRLLLEGNDAEKQEAREILIRRNMRLAAHIAGKYTGCHTERSDLISIGTIGLIKAVSSYSPQRGSRLGAYAARCIENEILMWIRKSRKESAEISMYESLGTDRDGNEISFTDILGTDSTLVSHDLELKMEIADLYHALDSQLTPREKVILIRRFGLFGRQELTQREIAQELGISRSYVSRIEGKALKKLRSFLENETPR